MDILKLNAICLLVIASVASVPVIALGDAPEDRLNVLLICVDDLRPELGCYGMPYVHSPNIDRLAASGVAFDRCHVQVAVCNPSRASTWTGIRPDRLGTWTLTIHFRESMPDAVTLPQYLRRFGYTCEGYGKIFHNPWQDPRSWDKPHQWGNAGFGNYTPEQRAFTKQVMETLPESDWRYNNLRGPITNAPDIADDQHADGAMTLLAIDRLKDLAKKDQPFFLAVGYVLPHLPWTPPKKYWDKYDRNTLPLAENPNPPEGAPEYSIGNNGELSHYADMIDMPTPYSGSLPESESRRLRHAYFAAISYVDAQIGRLLDSIEQNDLAGNTAIVLWSDHGYKLGEHNGWGKMTNFTIDTHIPMIIRSPRAKANGQRCNQLIESLDLYPTICDVAGVPVPDFIDGKNAAHLLDDPSAVHKDAVFSQYIRGQLMGNSILTDKWRYVEWRSMADGSIEAQELYDQNADAAENKNVVDQYPNVITRLQERLKSVLAPHPIKLVPHVHSRRGGAPINITWVNEHPGVVRVTWIRPNGRRHVTFDMPPGSKRANSTFIGHVFSVESLDGKYDEIVTINKGDNQLHIGLAEQ